MEGPIVELQVEALGRAGEGFCRSEGTPIFVPGALPGDRVRARLHPPRKGGPRRAELIEILSPSPGRRSTPCAHDLPQGCGGCCLLSASSASSATWKRDFLLRLLDRNGVSTTIVEETLSPSPTLAYRNRARFHVNARGELCFVGRGPLGRRGRRPIVPIDGCPVLLPRLDGLRRRLQNRMQGAEAVEVRAGAATGEALVVVTAENLPPGLDPVAINASILWKSSNGAMPLRGHPWIHEEVAGRRFRISAEAFFQINTAGAEAMTTIVSDMAGPLREGTALDLYAGGGLFSLTSLAEAKRRTAVESSPPAAADLAWNAAGETGMTVLRSRVEDALEDMVALGRVPDVVVMDPPREGLGSDVIGRLGRLGGGRLILVSCDPASMARDVAGLEAVGYRAERVVPVDLFPGTHHIEAITLLTA